eukprot:1229834-Alexandrium_andersonii.AAC.1
MESERRVEVFTDGAVRGPATVWPMAGAAACTMGHEITPMEGFNDFFWEENDALGWNLTTRVAGTRP